MTSKSQWSELLSPLHDEWQPHDRWDEIEAAIQRQTLHPLPSNTRKKPCKHPIILYTVMAVACVATVMCGTVLKRPHNNNASLGVIESNNTSTDIVIVNEIVSSNNRGYNPIENTIIYEKKLNINELISYLEYDIRPTSIPSDLQYRSDIFERTPPTIGYTADGTAVDLHNSNFQFIYTNVNKTPRQISIYYSKTNTVVGKMQYHYENNTLFENASTINNITVIIGHLATEMIFDNYDEKVATERYVAEFTVAGIHMQVTTDNLTLDEFLAVVKSIIR